MKRDIGWNLRISGVKRYISKIYRMFLSPEININCVKFRRKSRDQYTALLLERVLVTWYGRISSIYAFWYNFDTVLCQYLETGTSDRCFIGLDQLLRFSGFSLFPLLFFLYSLFQYYSLVIFYLWFTRCLVLK